MLVELSSAKSVSSSQTVVHEAKASSSVSNSQSLVRSKSTMKQLHVIFITFIIVLVIISVNENITASQEVSSSSSLLCYRQFTAAAINWQSMTFARLVHSTIIPGFILCLGVDSWHFGLSLNNLTGFDHRIRWSQPTVGNWRPASWSLFLYCFTNWFQTRTTRPSDDMTSNNTLASCEMPPTNVNRPSPRATQFKCINIKFYETFSVR